MIEHQLQSSGLSPLHLSNLSLSKHSFDRSDITGPYHSPGRTKFFKA